jgi:hypothetical protein
MTTALSKITLSASRNIPFNKLVLSQSNVRRVKAGVSIEELAEDIARRTLLQSLNVRPVRDAEGAETGMFEVPAGGRRFRALELLVKQKRIAKSQPVPCVIRDGGIAEDDSLAENDEQVGLHPLDQFRAFKLLHDVSDAQGLLSIARGYVRPEDEAPVVIEPESDAQGDGETNDGPTTGGVVQRAVITVGGAPTEPVEEEDDGTVKPLPDRLITELTAHRTLALRNALANEPAVAFRAVLYNFVLATFYRFASSSGCLENTIRTPTFPAQAPGLKESASAGAIDRRHEGWKARLPKDEADLWNLLTAFDRKERAALFAHCASSAVNALYEPANRYNEGRVAGGAVA